MMNSVPRASLFQSAVVAGFIFGIFLLFGHTAFAATYTVSKTADTADGTCDADCSLREAIIASEASAGADIITLPAGTYTISSGAGDGAGDFNIDAGQSLTINGADEATTIIDGNDTGRVFDVDSSSSTALALNNLTVQNGSLSGADGAGIRVRSGGTLTLSNVTLTSNTVAYSFGGSGSAIYCGSSTVTISNSTISNNTATGGVDGGAVRLDQCDATISNSTFSSNTAYNAGALRTNTDADSSVSITETTFTDNSASNVGGAIATYGDGNSTPVRITSSTFNGNTATGSSSDGGAIHVEAPVYITNATFYNNTAKDHGGAVMIYSFAYSDVSIAYSTFVGNQSDADSSGGGNGGGVYVLGVNPTVDIHASLFDDNVANGGTGPNCYGAASDTIDSLTRSLLNDSSTCSSVVDNAGGSTFGGSAVDVDADGVQDNGGAVNTIALVSDSTALDDTFGSCVDAEDNPLTVDARGMSRPEAGYCDIGAYEFDQTDPVITKTVGTDTVECSVGTWTDAGATIADNFDDTISGVSAVGSVTEATLGSYTITYSSLDTDYDGNTAANVTRTVNVVDTTGPAITVVGEAAQTITVGDTYTDAGATATDACDSSITVTVGGDTVVTSTAGEYTVTYNASDDTGNAATQKTRTVTVQTAAEESPEEETPEEETPEDTEEDVVTVTSNGKHVVVKVNGEVISRKQVGSKKLSSKYRKLKTKQLYTNYTTVALLTATKRQAKLTVFRLTENNILKKKVSKSFSFIKRNKLALTFKVKKKRIIATVGKAKQSLRKTWTLTKKGALKLQ